MDHEHFKRGMMRSHISAALMSLGGIFLAFGAVVVVLALLAANADAHRNIGSMHVLSLESIVGGAVLLGAGAMLRRTGRTGPGAKG